MRDKHYKGSDAPLKDKIEHNIWDSVDEFIKVLNDMREGKWIWIKNANLKYVNLRVDMRDGGCLIFDRNDKRIDPKNLAFQYDSTKPPEEQERKMV